MLKLSVVIPTYNRLVVLQRVLAGLGQQTLPSAEFEVIVVSDGATDGTPPVLRAMATPYQLIVVEQNNQGPAAARNRGVAQAQGDLIVFLDDDVVPTPQLLAEHLATHQAHGLQTISIGPMLPPRDHDFSPWVRWSQDRLSEQYQAMENGEWAPTARQFYTGNTSLARGPFLASGGFDASFKRAEDVELAYRLTGAGMQFLFNPRASGYHYETRSFAAWLAIPYAYGRSDVVFAHEKGQTWLLPTLQKEFAGRSVIVRLVTWLCLDRPRLSRWATFAFRQLMVLGHWLHFGLLARLACSLLFNLYHYQGIADGIGGRARFFAAAADAPTASAAAGVP